MREWIVVGALAVGGCDTVARGEIYEDMIEQVYRDEKGLDAEVECPDRIPLGRVADNRFECAVIWAGGRTDVIVQLGHAYNHWRLTPKEP